MLLPSKNRTPIPINSGSMVRPNPAGRFHPQSPKKPNDPESEVSRLLSLLKLNPAVQREARQDQTGSLTRRHLVALAQLPPEDQKEAMISGRSRKIIWNTPM